MTENKTGRPAKYTEAQVIKGIEIVERTGESPKGDTVKKAMCDKLGVAGGINAQSLDKEVHRLLEERERQRRNRLIAELPSATLGAAKEIRDVLIESGIECHALDLAVSANKNRPDRDKDDLSCPIEFSVA